MIIIRIPGASAKSRLKMTLAWSDTACFGIEITVLSLPGSRVGSQCCCMPSSHCCPKNVSQFYSPHHQLWLWLHSNDSQRFFFKYVFLWFLGGSRQLVGWRNVSPGLGCGSTGYRRQFAFTFGSQAWPYFLRLGFVAFWGPSRAQGTFFNFL